MIGTGWADGQAPRCGAHNESHSHSIEDAAGTKAKPKAEPDVDGLRLAVMKRAGGSRKRFITMSQSSI